jgi:mannose-6-phosphate isomerase-like protein (cupin superfamily)
VRRHRHAQPRQRRHSRRRSLSQADVADRDSPGVHDVALAGDTYSILVSGADTGGKYCLIDMAVPDGGGPPPHRHDYKESFTLLQREPQFTFRGQSMTVRAGSILDIPANAPHVFKNVSGAPARLLCLCVPAGLDAFCLEVGDPLESHASPRPRLDPAQMKEQIKTIVSLATKYRTELLAPDPDEGAFGKARQ